MGVGTEEGLYVSSVVFLGTVQGQVIAMSLLWFNSYFPLFPTHYHTLPYTKSKENTIFIEPRIKLNHNITTMFT